MGLLRGLNTTLCVNRAGQSLVHDFLWTLQNSTLTSALRSGPQNVICGISLSGQVSSLALVLHTPGILAFVQSPPELCAW